MMSFFQAKHDRLKPLVLMLTCFSLLFCNTWIPVPIAIEKDLSVAFPCQSKGCGCKNATQCWESCCCHSDSEKLAWARKNGVSPPKWFSPKVIAAKNPVASPPSTGGCCCCDKKAAPATSSAADALVARLEPSVQQVSTDQTASQSTTKDAPTKRVLLILKQQNDCQGNHAVEGFHQLKIQLRGIEPSAPAIDQHAESVFVFYNASISSAAIQWDPLPS